MNTKQSIPPRSFNSWSRRALLTHSSPIGGGKRYLGGFSSTPPLPVLATSIPEYGHTRSKPFSTILEGRSIFLSFIGPSRNGLVWGWQSRAIRHEDGPWPTHKNLRAQGFLPGAELAEGPESEAGGLVLGIDFEGAPRALVTQRMCVTPGGTRTAMPAVAVTPSSSSAR